MPACKCRYCQNRLTMHGAYKIIEKKQTMYFCDENHYVLFNKKIEDEKILKEEEKRKKKEEKEAEKKREKEEKEAEKQKQKEEREVERQKQIEEDKIAKEKRAQAKDKAYYLICEIIDRKEVINTTLWKEWALWNKVSSNEVIGQYLEENKNYLCNMVSKIDNNEYLRIRYLSAILKNCLGDYKPNIKAAKKPKTQVDQTFYEPVITSNNKRRSLADLEDEF